MQVLVGVILLGFGACAACFQKRDAHPCQGLCEVAGTLTNAAWALTPVRNRGQANAVRNAFGLRKSASRLRILRSIQDFAHTLRPMSRPIDAARG